jgi:hypothetical protein
MSAPNIASFVASVTDPTVPPTSTPASDTFGSSFWDVVTGTIDNLGDNGYQTGMALVVTTIAVIAMINISAPKWVIPAVGIGAFWAGWLGWNTLSGQDNPLFPGDVEAVKLWDVALAGDRGFLIVVIVACLAAVFVWRSGIAVSSRLMLMVGAVLGASFLYNLVEAVRIA